MSTGRPIVLLLDLLDRRWALRVLWELREPAESFRALRARCDNISSSVLWQRVNELKEAGFVDAPEGHGLQLTPLGVRLLESFSPLLAFAETWARARRNP
jgi:DNA-binding HxlR family transcriptional regulator